MRRGGDLIEPRLATERTGLRSYEFDDLAPGGGYILSTSNSVAEYIPLANYQAMLLTGHKYGKYPIVI